MRRWSLTLSASALALSGCADDGRGGSGDVASTSSSGSTTRAQDTTAVETTTGGTATGSTGGDASEGSTGTEPTTGSSEGATTGGETTDACDDLDAFVESLADAQPDDMPDLVDAFVLEAQYGEHGLPLRCGDRVVFVATAPAFVAGDFNDWDPRGLALEAPVEGAPLWLGQAEIPAPGGLYKHVDAGVFEADPLARRYGWDEFGEYSQIDADPARAHHERWPAFSDAAGPLQPRTVRVYVPVAANAGEELPVMFMHDGQNVFSPDALFGGWQASRSATAAIESRQIEPLLIVAIDNTPARLEEYSHVQDDIGGGPIGGLADAYADFVVDGVVPFIEGRYPTRPGSENTAVLGSSMGGLVSLHIGHRHPEVFGFVGSMSGTLGWGTFGLDNETMIERYTQGAPELIVYVDSGGGGACPTDGADNFCETVDFADVLRSQGWVDEVDLFYRWDSGAPHNEAAWAERFSSALIDWFPGAVG